jgi:hypothetical protein
MKPSKIIRPFPPREGPTFQPAPEVRDWVASTILAEEHKLYNPEQAHLRHADIAFLWARMDYTRQLRRIVGLCEEVTFRCGAWQKGRQEQQMEEWFGRVPEFVITIHAGYAHVCSDRDFCALIEHELFHIAHARDMFGAPRFRKDTGRPVLCIRGHDVEEFVGVVKRYGTGAPDGSVAELVRAANSRPEVGAATIAQSCGTCLLKAA